MPGVQERENMGSPPGKAKEEVTAPGPRGGSQVGQLFSDDSNCLEGIVISKGREEQKRVCNVACTLGEDMKASRG